MRFAAVAVAVLVCSNIYAQNKIDLSKPPAPPPTTNVNVLNFPEVQAVAGTISVDNLPAVQTVGGTVNVGNLPVDAEGAVRVTGAFPTTPPLQARYVSLFDGDLSIPHGVSLATDSVDTTGYSRVGVLIDGTGASATVQWSWGTAPERFGQVWDIRQAAFASTCLNVVVNNRPICFVSGDRIRLVAFNEGSEVAHVTALGVYLIP